MRLILPSSHAALAPDEVAHFTDAVVVGEAEEVWRQVLADAETVSLQRFHTGGAPAPSRYEEIVARLHDRDIHVFGTFVFGYDNERWWLDPQIRFLKPVFRPVGMSAQELKDEAQLLRTRIYSHRGIFSRLLRTSHALRSPSWLGFYLLRYFRNRGELKRLGFEAFGDPHDLAPIMVPKFSDLDQAGFKLAAGGH